MIDAYTIGVTLALNDGVSTGLAAIGRELAVLDGAIRSTSDRLDRLRAAAGDMRPGPLGDDVAQLLDRAARAAGGPPRSAAVPPASLPAAALAPPAADVAPEPKLGPPAGRESLQAAVIRPPQAVGPELAPARPAAAPAIVAPAGPARPIVARIIAAPISPAASAAADPGPPPAAPAAPALQQQKSSAAPLSHLIILGERLTPAPPPSRDAGSPATGEAKSAAHRLAAPATDYGASFSPAYEAGEVQDLPPHSSSQSAPASAWSQSASAPPRLAAFAATAQLPDAGSRDTGFWPPSAEREPLHSPTARVTTPRPLAAALAPTAPMPEPTAARAPASAVAPPARRQSGAPSQGDVYLDGTRMGRWIADHLGREANRPPAGPTGFDPRLGLAWPGATIAP